MAEPKTTRYESASNLLRPVMPELDTIRGIAILMVVFYHGLYWGIDLNRFSLAARAVLNLMWIGRLGVSLFFVLSGFLITGLLLESKPRLHYFSKFYTRRALRILPAYLVTIAVLVIFSLAPWKFVFLSLAYMSNLTPLFSIPIAYPVLWSLAVEEHFYFFWPIVVRTLQPRALLNCCLGIIIISPIIRALSFHYSLHNGASNFVCNEYTWNSIDGLATGALLAIWLRSATPTREAVKTTALLLLLGALALEIGGLHWGILTRQRQFGAALQVDPWDFFFLAALCLSLLVGTSKWKGLVHIRSLRFFGEISYGLYLYHLLAFRGMDYLASRGIVPWIGTQRIGPLLARFVLAFGLAVGLAYISRKTFEEYFLSLKKKWAPA